MNSVDKIKCVCEQCKSTFYRLPSQVGKFGQDDKNINRGRFCSRECMQNSKKNGSFLTCDYCGEEFYRRFGEQRRAKSQFCSRECYDSNRRENMKESTYIKIKGVHEHILVAENYLNRKLKKGEIVHHIDENKHNNNPNNLCVLPSQNIHADIHFGKKSIDGYRLLELKENEIA